MGKPTFLILIFSILILSSFASSLEFDNIQTEKAVTFDGTQVLGNELLEIYKPIEIVNIFGLGETLFEGYLSQHNNTCGTECTSTIEIKLHQDSVLIDDVIFKTLQEDGSWLEQNVRNYQFKYWGDVDDYGWVDGKLLDVNGSLIKEYKIIGYYKGWINYNLGDIMPAGIYTIKIEAEKKSSRTVDWIIKTNGEWLESWATWGNISEGDDGEVILNSPIDNFTTLIPIVTFNSSATVTGASLVNMSLWTNETGVWELRNLSTDLSIATDDAHGVPESTTATVTNARGVNILTLNNATLKNITRAALSTATRCLLYDSGNNILTTGSYSGSVCTITWSLVAGQTYRVANDNSGASYGRLTFDPASLPIQGTNINWTNSFEAPSTVGGSDLQEIKSIYTETDITSATRIWNRTINTAMLWNVEACDSDNDCGFAASNRTIFLESSAPNITVSSPNGTTNYNAVGLNETLNVTFTDSNLDSCWYNYNGTNITIDGCQTGINNITNFTLEENNLDMTLYGNDTIGNINSTTINWNYNLFRNSLNYSVLTRAGTSENFTINITFADSFSGISMLLNYNGTNHTMSTSDTNRTREYSTQLTVPNPQSETNITFFFIASLSSGANITIIETERNNQTISPFLLDNCSTFTKTLLDFTMVDEDSLQEINGTIEFTINIFSVGTTDLVNTFNDSYTYVVGEDSRVCLENITESYSMSYQIRHFGDEAQYFKKYRNVQLLTINNGTLPENITLYNLNITRGQAFNVIVVGNLLSSVGNVGLLVDAQRQYLSLEQFISVESSITDSSGVAISNLVETEEIYNFLVSYNGELLGTFNNFQVKCANAALGQCSITLNLASATGTQPDFDTAGNITQIFLLNTDTNTLHHTFSSTDGKSKTIRSLVIKDDGYGNTTICNDSASGTSGTILCPIPTQFQNVSFFVQTFESETLLGSKFFSQSVSPDWQGADILIMLLMFSSLVLLMVAHPVTIIAGAILGLTMPVLLISIAGASFGSLVGATLFYIAGGIIAIIIISKKKL